MSFRTWVEDLRLIKKPDFFKTGVKTQITKLNEPIDAIIRMIEAAERNAGDGGGALPGTSTVFLVNILGETKSYTFIAEPVQE